MYGLTTRVMEPDGGDADSLDVFVDVQRQFPFVEGLTELLLAATMAAFLTSQ